MSDSISTTFALSPIDEDARRRFEAGWLTGRPEPIGPLLPSEDAPGYLPTLEELVHLELLFAWKEWARVAAEPDPSRSRPQRVSAYLAQFPRLNQPLIVLRLLRREYLERRRAGDRPDPADYRELFPDRGASGEDFSTVTHSEPAAAPVSTPTVPGYDVIEELGRGAMGVVYKAHHLLLRRVVALKMVLGKYTRPEALLRFLIEAEAVAQLQHPHIVQVFEVSRAGDWPYLVMEFLEGGPLSHKLRDGPLPPQEAAALAETLARAVDYAHRRGIVHRDLKPGNILLTAAGLPKIGDFGLAKYLDGGADLTRTGEIVGTPAYMPPEQALARGAAVGPLADVYALGAILYECLTGQPPFRAATALETLELVCAREPVPPSQLRPTVPRDLETIVLKCLQKEPDRRYAGAEALAEDLRRFLAHEPIQARRIGAVGRLVRWCRRQPALAATIALAVCTVLAVAVAGFLGVAEQRDRYRHERDRAEQERGRAEAARRDAENNLYLALVGEAKAHMQARGTGWWWQSMDNLAQAARLKVVNRDVRALRELTIACIGTRYPCFRLAQGGEWRGHKGAVTALAVSPDGRLAASGSNDRTIRLWSVPEGRSLAVLEGHGGAIASLVFHADGRRLVSAARDGTARLWDVGALPAGGGPIPSRVLELPGAGAVNGVAFTVDGQWLAAACGDGTVRLLPVPGPDKGAPSAVRILEAHSGAVSCLAVSSAGKWLASGGTDNTIRIWDLGSERVLETWVTPRNFPLSMVFSPPGDSLIWADSDGFGATMRRVGNTATEGISQPHAGRVRQLLCDPRHRLLTASDDGTVKCSQFLGGGRGFQELAVAGGGFREVHALAATADGRWVVAGHSDGVVRLWELAEPPERGLLGGHCQNVAFIGPSRRLVAGMATYDLSADVQARGRMYDLPLVRTLAVHPSKPYLASGNDEGKLRIWVAPRGEHAAWTAHTRPVSALASSPDGGRLASASWDGNVKLWDWESGKALRTLQPGLGALHGLAWAADGDHLAAVGERGAVLWDLRADGDPRVLSMERLPAGAVAFGDGVVAVSEADGRVALHDLGSGKKVRTLGGRGAVAAALEFSRNGRRLAAGDRTGVVRLWDAATGKLQGELRTQHQKTVGWLAFHPAGRYLVAGPETGWPGVAMLWDLETGVATVNLGPSIRGRFTADGAILVMATPFGAARACTLAQLRKTADEPRGKAAAAPVDPPVQIAWGLVIPGNHTDILWRVAASPDGRWTASASGDGTVNLWDGQTLALVRTLRASRGMVWSLAFSPDSRHLASGSGDVRVWEAATGREVHKPFDGHRGLVNALAFHPHRPWLASSGKDGTLRLWDLEAGRPLGVLYQGEPIFETVTFSPDGHWLAAGGYDTRVALWDISELPKCPSPPTRSLPGHTSAVWAVAFSHDGKYFASGAGGGVVILWDGKRFERVVTLQGDTGEIRGLSFSRDDGLLAGAAYSGPMIVWDLPALRRTLRARGLDW